MTFSFFKENKLKFGKLILSTDELTKSMQSCFSLPLLQDVTLLDIKMKTNDTTKFRLSCTFTLGFVDRKFIKNKLIELLNDEYPHDIIGEICSFLCVDEYVYKFKFAHSYNCSVVQNHFGSQFLHQNVYRFECLNDPKFYSLSNSWGDQQFRALLLSMMCCGYNILKRSNCLKPPKNQQCHYNDGPLRQNMELFTKTVLTVDKVTNKDYFQRIFGGLELSKIDTNLKGLDEAIDGEKKQKSRARKRRSLLSSILPCIMEVF